MGKQPSKLVDYIKDKWAAYQFDNAVIWVGIVLENAVQEMVKLGSKDAPRWEPKYTMKQLLDDKFRLPSSDEKTTTDTDVLKGIHGITFDEVG